MTSAKIDIKETNEDENKSVLQINSLNSSYISDQDLVDGKTAVEILNEFSHYKE